MTPEQASIITLVVGLIQQLGAGKVASVLALLGMLPHLLYICLILYIVNRMDKRQDKHISDQARQTAEMREQFEVYRQNYAANIELVKQITKIAGTLQEVVVYNTEVMQGVKDYVKNNLFCPLIKKDRKVSVEVDR